MAELTKAYEPAAVEEKWYAHWLAQRFFTADPASSKPAFSIVIPRLVARALSVWT